MIGTLLIFAVSVTAPPHIDSRTGKLVGSFDQAPIRLPAAGRVLTQDTVAIRAYSLAIPNFVADPSGIDVAPGGTRIWFLVSWIDTLRGEMVNYLNLIDAGTTPGRETLCAVREIEVLPERSRALRTSAAAVSNSQIATPVSRKATPDTLRGIQRWLVTGYPVDLDAREPLWFTDRDSSRVARFDEDSAMLTTWSLPTSWWYVGVHRANDTTWYANADGFVGSLYTERNECVEWPVPGSGTPAVGFPGLERVRDGAIWLTRRRDEHFVARLERNGPAGKFDIWTLPYELADGPCDLKLGPDGKVWYSVMGVDSNYVTGKIGRFDPVSDSLTEWITRGGSPYYLELDNGGNCWFVETDSNRIGKVDPGRNTITEYTPLLAAHAQGGSFDLALDGSGNVWFTHGGGYVVKLSGVYGIEEPSVERSSPRLSRLIGATLTHGRIYVRGRECPVLLDKAGRRVALLRPGSNDVRMLVPGVYFVRSRATKTATKVVIQR